MESTTPFYALGDNRRGRFFYLIAGIAVLLPWNVCISTFSRFRYYNWPYTNSAAYTTALLASQMIGIIGRKRVSPNFFLWPFASLAISCLFVPLQIHFNIPRPYDFLLSCALVVLMAMSSSFSQLVTMKKAAIDDQGLVMSIGSGLAGPIAAMYGDRFDGYFVSAAACLVCSYWGDDNLHPEYPEGKSILPVALLSPTSTTTTISTAATAAAPQSPSDNICKHGAPPGPSTISTAATAAAPQSPSDNICTLSAVTEQPDACSLEIVVQKRANTDRLLKFTLFATYVLSFYCFPGRILVWMPRATALFQLMDFAGRCAPLFIHISWKIAPPVAVLRLPFLAFILIPSLMTLLTFEIKEVLIALFAFSNGLITSLIFAYSEDPRLGAEMSLSMILGLVTGSWLSVLCG